MMYSGFIAVVLLAISHCHAVSPPYYDYFDGIPSSYDTEALRDVLGQLEELSSDLISNKQNLETTQDSIISFITSDTEYQHCLDFSNSKTAMMSTMESLKDTFIQNFDEASNICSENNENIQSVLEGNKLAVEASIQSMIEEIGNMTVIANKLPVASAQTSYKPRDCLEAKEAGLATGKTTIYLGKEEEPQEVFCDQDTEGGGWMVMIRRQKQDEQLSFAKPWSSYVSGFGDLEGEHWIGLDVLHKVTKDPTELLVKMAIGSETAKSYYDVFRVEGSYSNYRLLASDYDKTRSTGGDSLTYHSGSKFSTYDRDNDGASGGSCSAWSGRGGWWFNWCFMSNPTGIYNGNFEAGDEADHFLEWREWQGYYAYLSDFVMLLRPRV